MKAAVLGAWLLAGCTGIAEAPIAPPAPVRWRVDARCEDGQVVALRIVTTGALTTEVEVPADFCETAAPMKPSQGI